MLCPKCLTNDAKIVQDIGPVPCDDCRLNNRVSSSEFNALVQKAKKGSWQAKKKLRTVSEWSSSGITYWDGSRKRFISHSMLRELKSAVTTHEGEQLYGQKARNYMDNHSKKYMGKDLSGSYNDSEITGYV